jgi:hypothetical protein
MGDTAAGSFFNTANSLLMKQKTTKRTFEEDAPGLSLRERSSHEQYCVPGPELYTMINFT